MNCQPDSIPVPVALSRVSSYDSAALYAAVDGMLSCLPMPDVSGASVLLKPNLVIAGHQGLACSQPEMVVCAARWFIDRGSRVMIGDSPAFGGGEKVMARCGIVDALSGMPVEIVDFDQGRKMNLAGGCRVMVAAAALECDLLVNLPRVKTHVQMLVTLAVKNLFGTVIGWRKPWLHARLGDKGDRFAAMFVDLVGLFPRILNIVDGIIAMEGHGPIQGTPLSLGFLAASMNPVAIDTAILDLVGIDKDKSPLWRECSRRGLVGCDAGGISFPLAKPGEIDVPAMILPEILEPESFDPLRLAIGAARRLKARFKP